MNKFTLENRLNRLEGKAQEHDRVIYLPVIKRHDGTIVEDHTKNSNDRHRIIKRFDGSTADESNN